MKIINKRLKRPVVSIVCCVHGDEPFGLKVFDYYHKFLRENSLLPIKVILANEKALKKGKRFIDQNLNTAFPGTTAGNYEEKLANLITEEVKSSKYVLDIHTTTSNVKYTPIFVFNNSQTKRILNLVRSKEIVQIKNFSYSLLGNIKSSVAIEFNEDLAYEKGIPIINNVVDALIKNVTLPSKKRKIFYIEGIIPLSMEIPKSAKNFRLIKGPNIYPFLLNEKSYTNKHGWYASAMKEKYL